EVDFTTSGTKTIQPFVEAGRLAPLAFTGPKRDSVFPATPTFTELGMPEVKANVQIGIFAPTGLSEAAHQSVREGVAAALNDPDFTQRAVVDRGFSRPSAPEGDLRQYYEKLAAERGKLVS